MSTFRIAFLVAAFSLMALSTNSVVVAGIIHVDVDATGANNGTSWPDAFTNLQEGVVAASNGDQVWVAEGTYSPTPPVRTATFHLKNGVALYGGFAGWETKLEQRDPKLNETILSGDLNGDDFSSTCCLPGDAPGCDDSGCEAVVCALLPECCENTWSDACAAMATLCVDTCDITENSYHVVTAEEGVNFATLDGFTVTRGNADGMLPHHDGGGMIVDDGTGVTIHDCVFIGNSALHWGGGLYLGGDNSFGSITQCEFIGNIAHDDGGGARTLELGTDLYRVGACSFVENISLRSAGGLASSGSLTVSNCVFARNWAFLWGGGATFTGTNGTLTNCLFQENTCATDGGGLAVHDADWILSGCTFTGNTASANGGGLFVFSVADGRTSIAVNNSILWNNQDSTGVGESGQLVLTAEVDPAVFNFNCIMGLTGTLGGMGNIGEDPLFVDAESGNHRLSPGSPCIDAANNLAVPPDAFDLDGDGQTGEPTPFDLDGNPRFVDDPATEDTGNPSQPGVPITDMGAYEFQVEVEVCEGDANGDGVVDPLDGGYVLARFGCPVGTGDPSCDAADVNSDGAVDPLDSGFVLARFGPCP